MTRRRLRRPAVATAAYHLRSMVYERHVLSNGLRVLTAPMPQAQSVSCFLMATT